MECWNIVNYKTVEYLQNTERYAIGFSMVTIISVFQDVL